LTATPDTETVYLSNSTTQPQTGVAFANTLEHTVTEGTGEKNIYIWFEDQAGNTSSFFTLIFDIIAGKSVDPAGDFSIEVGSTQTFSILGAGTEVYVWSIVDPDTGDSTTVATFDGASTNVAHVDVISAEEGFFKIQATPDGGTTVYESGTITVVSGYAKGDADGNGTVDATDALYVLHYYAGNISASDLKSDCDVDKSGVIDATDALYILHLYAGNITSFP